MKHIILSADAQLIEQAQRQAALQNTTLDDLFRTWLAYYVAHAEAQHDAASMAHICAGRHYTREEMNARR